MTGAGYPNTTRGRSSFRHLGHLRRLAPYARRYRRPLLLAIAGMLSTKVLFSLVPQLLRIAVDGLQDPAIPASLAGLADYKLAALGILAIVLLQAAIYFVSRRALRRISIAVTYDLRKRLFSRIQYQGASFFNRFDTGDLMSRAVNDVRTVRIAVSFAWVQIATVAFTFAAALFFMLGMSPALTVWVMAPLPLVGLTGFLMARGLYPYLRERQEAMAKLTAFTQENLNGIRTIQAMAQEDHEIARFARASERYAGTFYRASRYQQFREAAMAALTAFAPLVVIFHGGALVLEGELTVGTWLAFSTYLMMLTHAVTQIGWSLSLFVSAAASTERIYEVLDAEPEVRDAARGAIPQAIAGHLEFRGFRYRHPGAPRPAIRGIDLDVPAGQTIALLGRVGAGKSTLLKAAARLIDTPRGSIFLDGRDICDFPLRRLRRIVTLVPQDPFLFSALLGENITYDEPERGVAAVLRAACAAGLERTLREDLPDGLDTLVGERGITLSGGQKQRATLARGLIRDAPVLLLDDCFSSVDTETEEHILSGLQRLRRGRTTLLISHRVSTARHAQRIYVIDDGRVLESGSHVELLARGGYYAQLEAAQGRQQRDRAPGDALLRTADAAPRRRIAAEDA